MARIRFATTLRDARTRTTLTQKELAAEIGVNAQTIYYWETAQRIPAPKHLRKLAVHLGLDWDMVLKQRKAAEAEAARARAVRVKARQAVDTVTAVATILVATMAF